jgi:signal transduction histidine kinase
MDAPSTAPKRASRPFLALAFALVVLISLAMATVTAVRTRSLEVQARDLVGAVVVNTREIARVQRDLDQMRFLIDEHVFERSEPAMEVIEQQIAATRTDVDAAARAHEASAPALDARSAWRQLIGDWSATMPPVERVLALSRRNEDEEARALMPPVTRRFEAVALDVDQLFAANDEATTAALTAIRDIRRRLLMTLAVAAIAEIFAIVIVAHATLRVFRRYEDAAARSLEALELRNRDLDAFAARAAHDIRGPLTSIKLAAERMIKETQHAGASGAALRRGIARMEALIDDLLALASVGEHVTSTCDPATVASQLVEDFAQRLETEHGAIRVSVEHARTNAGEGLLRQAMANLTDNAIKYHRPDVAPEIEIVGRVEGSSYSLRLSDNGVGMEAQDARHAFDPLYRAKATRHVPGTGIGLSIVKRVVEASGGSVRVAESRAGKGTTFEIRLALAPPDECHDALG